MDKDEALIYSWCHWWRLSQAETWEEVVREGLDPRDCDLCFLFYGNSYPIYEKTGDGDGCLGCPVYEATGEPYCHCTPYQDAAQEFAEYIATTSPLWRDWGTPLPKMDAFRDAARRELKFLASLMPDGTGR